jgi:DNA-binding transcriptional ArsR family regulator
MVDRDYILAPQVVKSSFALVPVLNQIESIGLINEAKDLSGLADWVTQTRAALTPAQLQEHTLMMELGGTLLYNHAPIHQGLHTLRDFADHLAQRDPIALRDESMQMVMRKLAKHPEFWSSSEPIPSLEDIMTRRSSFALFFDVLTEGCFPREAWEAAFELHQSPPDMIARIQQHLYFMWDTFLAEEWARNLPMLQESLAAFQHVKLDDFTLYEAVRAVTGRDMRGKFDAYLHEVERVIFVPNAHIGPYVGKMPQEKTIYLLFGARLPRGIQAQSSDLTRAELLIRMNALADDTRLRILEMLTQQDEMCAQDIIEALGLSQSSVSRHLSQLSATGYIVERRRDVNKCYSLNTDRVVDTVRALTNFLARV